MRKSLDAGYFHDCFRVELFGMVSPRVSSSLHAQLLLHSRTNRVFVTPDSWCSHGVHTVCRNMVINGKYAVTGQEQCNDNDSARYLISAAKTRLSLAVRWHRTWHRNAAHQKQGGRRVDRRYRERPAATSSINIDSNGASATSSTLPILHDTAAMVESVWSRTEHQHHGQQRRDIPVRSSGFDDQRNGCVIDINLKSAFFAAQAALRQ